MSKVLIVYGSSTGNTESIAESVGSILSSKGAEVDVKNAADVSAEGLCDGYDVCLFGCSAWGTDEVEMQEDFNAVFESFDSVHASGKKCATFASGDSSFEHFCGGAEVIRQKLEEMGAVIIAESLKVEGGASDNESEVNSWAEDIAKAL